MGRKNVWKAMDKHHPKLAEVKRMLCRKIVVALREERRAGRGAAVYLGTSLATISRMNQEKTLVRLRPLFELLIVAHPDV